jgi:hypothetical protein
MVAGCKTGRNIEVSFMSTGCTTTFSLKGNRGTYDRCCDEGL